ncbi:MAG TPA: hypothetical protein VFZ09_23375 [Archangium sp.]|uniref:hypothetical protein n=1 Tax=Archangium sp. TaxID=1872627 RepID=UPI002E35057C|nr:hypothetical protein [Archangium sp.]HEX5749192.1 hypothetical protein [Archangium sp.]
MRVLCRLLICGLLLVARLGHAGSAGQPSLSPATMVLAAALPDSIRFKNFGGMPEYVRISSSQGQYLSWQNRAIMSDNNFHIAVRYGGRIYDAFTGSGGMLEKDYLQSIIMAGEPIIKTVVSP